MISDHGEMGLFSIETMGGCACLHPIQTDWRYVPIGSQEVHALCVSLSKKFTVGVLKVLKLPVERRLGWAGPMGNIWTGRNFPSRSWGPETRRPGDNLIN